ncbi:sulfite exporter TauE/SafE family protein [Actinocorallia sp. API 0066]|uniref:sulfite exporter TauE/SafE family protein n=1 Tax=Actinocorallia sp. API 0066 TaxID=2896846 RepID=UPI001E65DC58|nr:sulfite exporter TauE/SafE family protein [Actinocorallia sp. API 0066]MCD0449888.1 sulfite exporter TauE/SafE family protein [Actinocorallia sp. API 0066]
METHLLGFAAGALISVVTAPVGVSGAVFLLPVQLSVLNVPNPAVTPTNLLYNVVSGPGALLRYRRRGQLGGPLTRLLVLGTLPGVVVGAILRVFAVPGPQAFRILVGAFLLPLGLWLCYQTLRPARKGGASGTAREPSPRTITGMAMGVGVIGGIYGIGGGSILGPILAGRGIPMTRVAPAALASTFVTSIVGALTYLVLSFFTSGDIAPHWTLGIACGLGGLVGGYLGARLQPRMPEKALRLLLGVLACALAVLYLVQGLT